MEPNQPLQPQPPQDPQNATTPPSPAEQPAPAATPSIVPQPFNSPTQTEAPVFQPTFGTETSPTANPQFGAQPQPAYIPPSSMNHTPGTSRTKLIIAGVGGMVLLIGLVVGFVVFGGDKDASSDTAKSTDKETAEETEDVTDTDEDTQEEQDDTTEEPVASSSKPVTVNKGFSVSAANNQLAFDIKVLNYELGVIGMSSSGFEQKPFDDANQYMMVKFSVKNKGDGPDDIFTSAITVTDDAGETYSQSYAFYSTSEKDWGNREYYETAGSTPVGKTKTGHLMFEVPKDAKSLTFTFNWEVDVIGGTDVSQVKKVKLF